MENDEHFEKFLNNLPKTRIILKGDPKYYDSDSDRFIEEFDFQIEEFRNNHPNYAKFQEEFEICVTKWEGWSTDFMNFVKEFYEEFEYLLDQPFDQPGGYYAHIERQEVLYLELEKSKKECLQYMSKLVEKSNLE